MNKKILFCISIVILTMGCGKTESKMDVYNTDDNLTENDSIYDEVDESANDALIDFNILKQENEDVVGWLTINGSSIDCVILQSGVSDDYYRNHNSKGENDSNGAVYIEMPTMPDMCGFNSIIHGSTALLGELYNYENPEYFGRNEQFNVYIPGNVLTYETWAAFERENNNLLDIFDFSDGKGSREFLEYVYNERIIGKQIREGFENLNEYNYITTLVVDDASKDKQLVVLGVLINDAAGTIHSEVEEELFIAPSILEQSSETED